MIFREFVDDNEKAEYFKNNYFRHDLPSMDNHMICLECHKKFIVKDFKVVVYHPLQLGQADYVEIIVCPNAPECGGIFLDWMGIESLN